MGKHILNSIFALGAENTCWRGSWKGHSLGVASRCFSFGWNEMTLIREGTDSSWQEQASSSALDKSWQHECVWHLVRRDFTDKTAGGSVFSELSRLCSFQGSLSHSKVRISSSSSSIQLSQPIACIGWSCTPLSSGLPSRWVNSSVSGSPRTSSFFHCGNIQSLLPVRHHSSGSFAGFEGSQQPIDSFDFDRIRVVRTVARQLAQGSAAAGRAQAEIEILTDRDYEDLISNTTLAENLWVLSLIMSDHI